MSPFLMRDIITSNLLGGRFMRRIIKTPSLLVATATMLASCSTGSIAGTYGFQMGKETGTHFGVYLKLTDKYVTIESQPEETKKYKECTFSFSIKYGDDTNDIANIIAGFAELLGGDGDKLSIKGYYYKSGKSLKDGSQELKLGVDFSYLKEQYPGLEDLKFPELTPDVIEKVVYTTYLSNVVTLNIPVGIEDLLFQLYWYGIDFEYVNDVVEMVQLPEEKHHEPGTHPTDADVELINQTYKADHQTLFDNLQLTISAYRDYYTLGMGLAKK